MPHAYDLDPDAQSSIDSTVSHGMSQNVNGPAGIRTRTLVTEKRILSPRSAQSRQALTKSGSTVASSAPRLAQRADHDLDMLIDAWPSLSDAIHAGIMAMVRASSESPFKRE